MNVTLRHLNAFVTIARLNSFVEASRALHVTPAALSNVMRELEDIVGFRLLDRTTRRVRLSEAGSLYISHAEEVLAAMDKAERCAADLRNHSEGVVRIATTRFVGWTLMSQVYSHFKDLYPNVRVLPVDVPIEDICATVETGLADIAISSSDSVDDQIETVPLFQSRIYIVCRPQHQFADRSVVKWAEIVNEPLIFAGQHLLMRLQLELNNDFHPSNVYKVGDTTTALGLVAAGVGIAVCPGYVKPATRVHNLKLVACEDPVVVRQYMLCTNKKRTLLPVTLLYKEFLIDYFSQRGNQCVEDLPQQML